MVQNQQQTISLLVSEKASLSASLERLTDVESSACSFLQFLFRGRPILAQTPYEYMLPVAYDDGLTFVYL